MITIAKSPSDDVFGYVLGGVVVGVVLLIFAITGYLKVREFFWPRKIGNRFRRFFGKELSRLQPHEKAFPGFDLGSLSRGLASLLGECCTSSDALGSVSTTHNIRDLLSLHEGNYHVRNKPSPISYERLPVDVDQEESFVSNCLYLATLKGAAGESDERIAVQLAMQVTRMLEYEDDLDARAAPVSQITVGVACRSKAVADRFFSELEARRKRLSIYRGKVIDPVVSNGGIQTIAFRRIQGVSEADLVLPGGVKELLHGAIIAFYQHQEALASLGVETKRGILFHSPPGTGKTSISLYLAGKLPNFTVCFVSGKRLLYPREVCGMARYLQPAMLVFEDIDLIAQERDFNGLATVLGELMNQIDGCEPNDRVLFVMNTNSMQRIEQAVRNRPGRVDQIVHIPLPDTADRRRLLHLFARRFAPAPEELDRVAEATEGATPAMLKEIVKRAAVSAVARTAQTAETAGAGDGDGDGRADHDAGDNGDGEATPPRPPSIVITAQDLLLAYGQVQYLRDMKAPASEIL